MQAFLWFLCLCALVLTSCSARGIAVKPEPSGAAPPRIWAVAVANVMPKSARVSWTTDRAATSEVYYRISGETAWRLERNSELTRIHVVQLSGLKPDTTCEYEVHSVDAAGSRGVFQAGSFLPRDPTIQRKIAFEGQTILGACCGRPEISHAAGMHADRFGSGWDGLVPRRGEWDRKRFDDYVAKLKAFRAAGIETVISLNFCVKWARQLTDTQASWRHPAFGPPDHLADWKDFCRGIMQALGGAPQWYEIWNEPDAGYLATPLGPGGKQRWTPDDWQPTIDPLFQSNTPYWITDRYAPLVFGARETAEELGADVRIMAPGWNHDFHGSRGEMLFNVGVHRVIDAYSFHCYVGKPLNFEGWRNGFEIYLENIDRIFAKHKVDLPLILTEYGFENMGVKAGDGSLASPEDRAIQLAKATLLALSKHRFTMLCAFNLAGGDMGLADEEALPFKPRPIYFAYKHLVDRFSRKRYEPFRGLKVQADGAKVGDHRNADLWVHAFHFPESGEVLVAAWQGMYGKDTRLPMTIPARDASFAVPPPGDDRRWQLYQLDINGREAPLDVKADSDGKLSWSAQLPATAPDHETPPSYFLLRPH